MIPKYSKKVKAMIDLKNEVAIKNTAPLNVECPGTETGFTLMLPNRQFLSNPTLQMVPQVLNGLYLQDGYVNGHPRYNKKDSVSFDLVADSIDAIHVPNNTNSGQFLNKMF